MEGNFKREFILIKARSERITLHKIFCDDIIAFEAKNNYVKLHLINGDLLSYIGISEIAELFSHDTRFIRLHRSFIIAKVHVKIIRQTQIVMVNDMYFNVGEMYAKDFYNFLSHYLIKSSKY